jgi:hypothetical protein
MAQQFAHKIDRVLGGLLIASSLTISGFMPLKAIASDAPRNLQTEQAPDVIALQNQSSLSNGVYLYGETLLPDQLGATYMVFEVDNNQVKGAFYMPRSSFDCFQGQFAGNQLDLTVTNSYDQMAHNVSLILENDSYIASIGDPMTVPASLNGLHNLATISENDYRILETCKADF